MATSIPAYVVRNNKDGGRFPYDVVLEKKTLNAPKDSEARVRILASALNHR